MILMVGILVLIVLATLILYARWNYGSLEKLGIPVEKPHFILGNTKDVYKTCAGLEDIERFKRLGPVHGVYEGRSPQIHICDAELVRLVTSKDSEYFNDRRRADFRDPLINEMPDFLPLEKWKTVRTLLTPAFTAAKMKHMNIPMKDTLENFAKDFKTLIKSTPGQKLEKNDFREAIFAILTDMISRSCFSVQIDNPTDPNNYFNEIARKMILPDNKPNPTLETWAYSFPIIKRLSPGLFGAEASKEFENVFLKLVDARRKSGQKVKDVVDICMEMMDKLDTPEFKRLNITKQTVVCAALTFFFAAQDQISSIIAGMIYYILKNPDFERKLHFEVDEFLKKHKGEYDRSNFSELEYTLACINETLRLMPFFSRTERVCTEDWKNEEFNLEIKKGITVILPIWAINRNPKYFPDPEKFDPERFLSPNKEKLHPYAFTSFGHGPRNCIAVQFAIEVLILMNVVIHRDFKFHLRPDSKPEFIPGGPVVSPHLPFYFDVTVRNKK